MSGFEVIMGGLWSPTPPPPTPVVGSEKRLVCGGLSYSITHVVFNAKTVESLGCITMEVVTREISYLQATM